MDGRNHNGRTRQDECESTEAVKHTRVREKARVRERVPDGLRPDGVAKAKVLPEPPGALTTWRRSPLYLYL